ncbi:MAG: EFR1 family ferrodoxin [Oscillospiraceae bacterium]|nr:EFR1 family ferrodoxin [Oscillospiraceae bacterium]
MDNKSLIYWFSGTGNSLYAAKKLSEALGNITLVQITNEPPVEPVGGDRAKIGFVFPSYYGNLPRAVRAFIEKLEFNSGTYIFSVVTMGAPFGQGSIAALEKVLAEKGMKLNYGRGMLMPANYIIKYNPMFIGRAAKADKHINRIADEIKAQKPVIKKNSMVSDSLYKDIKSLDKDFTVSGKCTGCGLCENICPVQNIKLENDKPVWQRRCEHCVACISWCPARAIEYGGKTASRNRYCNPHIKADELVRKNDGYNNAKQAL